MNKIINLIFFFRNSDNLIILLPTIHSYNLKPAPYSTNLLSATLLARLIFEKLKMTKVKLFPEQFTVKTHPALFEREGKGEWEEGVSQKMRNCYSSLQLTHRLSKRAQNTKIEKTSTRSVRLLKNIEHIRQIESAWFNQGCRNGFENHKNHQWKSLKTSVGSQLNSTYTYVP